MAVFAVYVEKQAEYFGKLETFGNTYHYSTLPGQEFLDEDTANHVAEEERKVTQSNVQFVGWRTWGPTDGTQLANIIRASGDLDGIGGALKNSSTYKEACALVVLEIARSPLLNRRRWLRKFLRMPGGSTAMPDDVISGQQAIPQGLQDELVAYGNAVKRAPGPGADPYGLCTEEGDVVPLGTNAEVRPYLFTRQIGR